MTPSDRHEAYFARAERAHRAAIEQLKQNEPPMSASAWREAYVAAFTKFWFMEGTQPTSTTPPPAT